MSFDYTKSVDNAATQIQKFGDEATLTKVTGGSMDPATGLLSGETSTDYTIYVVNLPASKGTVQAFDNRIRELYLQGKIRFFLAQAKDTPTPLAGDKLTFAGSTFRVLGATPFSPAGTAIIYKFAASESA